MDDIQPKLYFIDKNGRIGIYIKNQVYCSCGGRHNTYNIYNRRRHRKSKKHTEYIQYIKDIVNQIKYLK